MFLWDYLTTLWFEFYFTWGKLKLRWPLIPCFLTRYSALGFVIGCVLFQTPKQPLNCDALYLGGNLLGKVAIASASVNLLVRTVIIWSYRWYIVLILGLIVSGEVMLICLGLKNRNLFATWSDELQSCTVSFSPGKSDLALFAPYALCVDCVIVSLTIIGLRKFGPKTNLANVLIRQGLSFFLLVVLPFQTIVTVTVYSNKSDASASTSSVLCGLIVPTVSCHMVRSILSGSFSVPGPCATSQGGPTADAGHRRRDSVQLTTHVELGSSSE